jgi:hypothetical protein
MNRRIAKHISNKYFELYPINDWKNTVNVI